MTSVLDFNHTAAGVPVHSTHERDTVRDALLGRLEEVLATLFPAGKVRHQRFFIGDALGNPGRSLDVVLAGSKAGLWTDRAAGEGGDIFDLLAAHFRLDVQHDFGQLLERARNLLGCALPTRAAPSRKAVPIDELGPATAKWDYLDAGGALIACVYRYDPPGGKEFRPWDARRRRAAPPTPRPLYHQPGIADAEHVVLVEGEKCAQQLIDAGICATTAMHGANAPIDKTDWSPLADKHVLIWPDKDKPGWDYALAASEAVLDAGACSCAVLVPPADRPEGWDAADALNDGFDVMGFLGAGERMPILRSHRLAQTTPVGPVMTDDALALAFTRHHGADWRYCAAWGKWLVWTGQRWNTDRVLYVAYLVRALCRSAAQQADKPALQTRLASGYTVASVERLARSDPAHAATAEEWDADPWALNTPGGVVDLRNGQTQAHARSARMTKQATASMASDAMPATWLRFLTDVTGGDTALLAYLQRVAGYCLTGATHEHALFFFYGTGANGKSVFVNTLLSLLGDYATHAPMDTFMDARSDRHPTDLAGLRGARFVAAVETEQGRRWNESKLKAITGGDTISARFMRQDFFEYIPQFKLVIAGNHKPSIRNVDEAMRRRLHLIPFTVTIPPDKRDGRLTEKLLAERDAILAWAIQGCLLWQREGLKPPACVVAATQEYFEAEDALGQWIQERCVVSNAQRQGVSDLFNDWRDWAERAGEYIGSVKRFSELMTTRRFDKCRLPGGARALAGIGLRPHPASAIYRGGYRNQGDDTDDR